MIRKIHFTKSGHTAIKNELDQLRNEKHGLAKERLTKARAMGDLRENSEYHAAKEDLAVIVGRISELEEMLRWAVIVDGAVDEIEHDLVRMGCKVVIDKSGTKEEYHIVGEFEADPLSKKLSHTSPMGSALIGKRKGDVVEIKIPSGRHTFTILDVRAS
jgi:transcription elongation factor GreA